jgi:hypothetical protein
VIERRLADPGDAGAHRRQGARELSLVGGEAGLDEQDVHEASGIRAVASCRFRH